MGRQLYRVPLDFAQPIGEIWPGYLCEPRDGSAPCTKHVRNPSYTDDVVCILHEPPTGDGFQLWETTSEGSPITPVFATLDELCAYAAEHCTTFADFKTTAAQWREMLEANFVRHSEGMFTFC